MPEKHFQQLVEKCWGMGMNATPEEILELLNEVAEVEIEDESGLGSGAG